MTKPTQDDDVSQHSHTSGTDRKRRRLVQAAGTVLAASTLPTGLARAASRGSRRLRVGFCSPRTGPLAGFGVCDPFVLQLARKALAHGLRVDGKRYEVEILDRDTQSDPTRASQLANSLINEAHVDLMLSTSTPEVVNPVADACEAAGVPSLSTVVPWESFYFGRGAKPGKPSPFHWSYLFCFGSHDFFVAYNSQWNGPVKTNKRVGVLYPNDADGNAVRYHLAPLLAKSGFTIVDPGAYQDGTTDFSAQIAKFKSEECEIFNTFPIPPDFATFWRQAAQQGYTRMVKIAQIAKTGLFPSQVEALGSLGDNLATAVYWHPTWPYKSLLTGMSSQALSNTYEKSTGRQWTQQLGASMALLDAGIATLRKSGNPKSKDDVVKAIRTLDIVSLLGPINFKTGPVPNVSATPIIGAQWVKAKSGPYKLALPVTENADDPQVPIGAQLVPYNA